MTPFSPLFKSRSVNPLSLLPLCLQDATNSRRGGAASRCAPPSPKKDRALGVLAQRFIMLFMERPNTPVALDDAAERLIFGVGCPEAKRSKSKPGIPRSGNARRPLFGKLQPGKLTDARCFPFLCTLIAPSAKVRRLYDISNILMSLHMITKVRRRSMNLGRSGSLPAVSHPHAHSLRARCLTTIGIKSAPPSPGSTTAICPSFPRLMVGVLALTSLPGVFLRCRLTPLWPALLAKHLVVRERSSDKRRSMKQSIFEPAEDDVSLHHATVSWLEGWTACVARQNVIYKNSPVLSPHLRWRYRASGRLSAASPMLEQKSRPASKVRSPACLPSASSVRRMRPPEMPAAGWTRRTSPRLRPPRPPFRSPRHPAGVSPFMPCRHLL
jgi:hypothetical protein